MAQDRRKKKKGGALTAVIIVVAVVVLAVSLLNIFSLLGTDMASDAVWDEMRSHTAFAAEGGMTMEGDLNLIIDFDALKEINDEIVAWIVVPGTPVDFPVVYTDNNKYYLSHSADKTENRNGAVFIDEINKPDFSDQNTVIYGHNMKSGAMFAKLHNFEGKAFFNNYPNFFIYTPDGKKHTYRIFGVYETKSAGSTYDISFADDAAFRQYIADAKAKSLYQRDVDIGPGDKIVTLSTCVKDAKQNRLVLQGVLVPDEDVQVVPTELDSAA